MACSNGKTTIAPGEPVERPADTTGAGDVLGPLPTSGRISAVRSPSIGCTGPCSTRARRQDADWRRRCRRSGDAPPRGHRPRTHAAAADRRLIASPDAGSKKCRCRWSMASSRSSPGTTGRWPSTDAQNRARLSSASRVASSSDAASIAASVASVWNAWRVDREEHVRHASELLHQVGSNHDPRLAGGASSACRRSVGRIPRMTSRGACPRGDPGGSGTLSPANATRSPLQWPRPRSSRATWMNAATKRFVGSLNSRCGCRTAAAHRPGARRPAGRASSPRPGRASRTRS